MSQDRQRRAGIRPDCAKQREEKEELVAVETLAERRSGERADDAGAGESHAARPADIAGASMIHQSGRGIGSHRERGGADRDVRLRHADQIDHQWHRENRPAAADQAEREANKHTRQCAEDHLHQIERGGIGHPFRP